MPAARWPSDVVPDPIAVPISSPCTVVYVGDAAPEPAEPADESPAPTDHELDAPANGLVVGSLDDPKDLSDPTGTPSAGCSGAAGGPSGALLALLMLLVLVLPRRRGPGHQR